MALLWFDGFESYNDDSDMESAGYIRGKEGGISGDGRRSGRCLWLGKGVFASDIGYLAVSAPGTPATVIWGIAVYNNSTNTPANSYNMFRVYDLFEAGVVHLNFRVNSDRAITVNDSGMNQIAVTSNNVVPAQQWFYLEIKVTISATVGQVTIKKDGVAVLTSAANLNTLNGSNAYVGRIQLGLAVSATMFYDDFYVCDTSGSENNDFLGDVRVDPLRPNGAGTYTDFTPSAGSNYENVDGIYPDDDTTYNDGSNVADQDSYALESLPDPAGTAIFGVKSQITVRKTDAGSRQCKILTRAGTTDDLGDAITMSDTYTTHTKILEDNPDDSADWEDADINGMEVGVEITA